MIAHYITYFHEFNNLKLKFFDKCKKNITQSINLSHKTLKLKKIEKLVTNECCPPVSQLYDCKNVIHFCMKNMKKKRNDENLPKN